MKAVVADPVGGPENLKYIDREQPKPAPGEALVKLEAVGVNFIDIYFRQGLYKAPETPVQIGSEGAGVIVETTPNSQFHKGDRVAFAMSRGSYAEYQSVPEKFLVKVPDAVSVDDAAAAMLQGMTAHYLTRSTFPLGPQHTCLVHAAAGGAGLMIVQMAKIAGATVIGTCSTAEKEQLVRSHGADHVVRYTEQDFVAEVKRITNNAGVNVVYDSVGKSTFWKSLDCLKPRGLMASFGQSSGPVGDIDPLLLSQKGSLFLTRPSLGNYIADRAELDWRAREIFEWIADGKLKLQIYRKYKLADAAEAQRDLESRKTTGKLLLKP